MSVLGVILYNVSIGFALLVGAFFIVDAALIGGFIVGAARKEGYPLPP